MITSCIQSGSMHQAEIFEIDTVSTKRTVFIGGNFAHDIWYDFLQFLSTYTYL
jgi:hypothetical protein